MPKLDDARTQILMSAQQLAQSRGYAGFSFRDVANEIGIKSASIHYHFPTKDDLMVALVDRFMDDFFGRLDAKFANNPDPKAELKEFISQFRSVLDQQNHMCLCGMMAAEIALLGPKAQDRTRYFFDRAEDWLAQRFEILGAPEAQPCGVDMLARIEGALLSARARSDVSKFEVIAARLVDEIDAL